MTTFSPLLSYLNLTYEHDESKSTGCTAGCVSTIKSRCLSHIGVRTGMWEFTRREVQLSGITFDS